MFDNERDVERMARVRDGDVEAFEGLFRDYKDHIAKFFYHLCWDHQRTQDCVQEVFLRVWRSAHTFRARAKFSTWLYQVAKNFWINERARESRRLRPLSLSDSEGRDLEPEELEGRQPAPLDALMDTELGNRIREAVSSLDDKKQVVFVLSEYQGMKYADIGEILGIPEGTVKSRMAAAERILREKLRRYLEEEGG